MYLGLFDSSAHTHTEKRPVSLNSVAAPFARLYGGLLRDEQTTTPQQVEWKPVQYKDVVTYIRYAV
jgi:hypothetical protein